MLRPRVARQADWWGAPWAVPETRGRAPTGSGVSVRVRGARRPALMAAEGKLRRLRPPSVRRLEGRSGVQPQRSAAAV